MNSLQINNRVSFGGYNARALKGVVMRNSIGFDMSKIASQMSAIGDKHGFDVICESRLADKKPCKNPSFFRKILNAITGENLEYDHPWVQDILYFTKDKMLIEKPEGINHQRLCEMFHIGRKDVPFRDFISGGNLFLLQDGDAQKILMGSSEKYGKARGLFKKSDITVLPQADFHIDLFVRPLKNNVVIVADDNMTLSMLEAAKDKLESFMHQGKKDWLDKIYKKLCTIIKNMRSARESGNFADTDEVISTLQRNGYEVVRTAGRIYHDRVSRFNIHGYFIHKLNFINAVAATDKSGEIVYISNKTNLLEELGLTPKLAQELGLDFESKFKDSVKEYIKPENIYFIEGADKADPIIYDNIAQILEKCHGGIHCLCAEIPA